MVNKRSIRNAPVINLKNKINKRGEVTWELVRTILFVALLVAMVIIIRVMFTGKGGELLDSVMKVMRFGR